MGLQNQLNDIASDSIPLMMLAIIANSISHLRSLLFRLLTSLGLSNRSNENDTVEFETMTTTTTTTTQPLFTSGLAGFILLTEQLNLNRALSHRFISSRQPQQQRDNNNVCVFCLSCFKDGDHVRELACTHVFHKECFDGWLDHLKFNCPLCRFPLVNGDCVDDTRRRVAQDFVGWFALY